MKNRSTYLLFIILALLCGSGFAAENIFGIDKNDLTDKIKKSTHMFNISDLSIFYTTKNYDVIVNAGHSRDDRMTVKKRSINLITTYPYFYPFVITYNKVMDSESPEDAATYNKKLASIDHASTMEFYADFRQLNFETKWQALYIVSTIDSNQAKIPVQIAFKNGQNTYNCLGTQYIRTHYNRPDKKFLSISQCNQQKLKLFFSYNVDPHEIFNVKFDDGVFFYFAPYDSWNGVF